MAALVSTMDLVTKTNVVVTSISEQEPRGAAKALTKGLALVELIAAHSTPIRLVDLVNDSELPRATVLRLLEVLCRCEVVRMDEHGSYRLGARVAAWGQTFLDHLDVRVEAVDLMQRVVAATSETCFLGGLDDGRVLYLAVADGPQAVRPAARVGHRNPLHSTGIGKAILANLPQEDVEKLLAYPLERRTPNTITDAAALHRELEVTRARGYAVDDVENEDGVRCIAAPVRDHTGSVVAAMSVSAPAYRFSLQDVGELSTLIIRIANELSARLGEGSAPAADPRTVGATSHD